MSCLVFICSNPFLRAHVLQLTSPILASDGRPPETPAQGAPVRRLDRTDPRIMPEARYFSMPSTELGAEVRIKPRFERPNSVSRVRSIS